MKNYLTLFLVGVAFFHVLSLGNVKAEEANDVRYQCRAFVTPKAAGKKPVRLDYVHVGEFGDSCAKTKKILEAKLVPELIPGNLGLQGLAIYLGEYPHRTATGPSAVGWEWVAPEADRKIPASAMKYVCRKEVMPVVNCEE